MPRGGSRLNAGRKKGSATAKTREVADRESKGGGVTPLEVLLAVRTAGAIIPATVILSPPALGQTAFLLLSHVRAR